MSDAAGGVETETVDVADTVGNARGESGTPDSAPAEVQRLTVEVDHASDVTYALVYNRAPIIRRLKVTNSSGGMTGPLTVRAAIRWTASEASPSLPFEVVLELPAFGESIVVESLDFRLDDTVMVDVSETTAARLELTLSDSLGVTQVWRSDVSIHARNQWLSRPEFAQLTAAFVQPNHPSVNEVLSKAGEILAAQGRDRSLSGYQTERVDPEHIRAMGAAIFLALQSKVDQYINPPAGYSELGQKLRPIDEVLSTRQGTCIDLACAYASCLEQAGLHPLVFLVHGHAFTGFFLEGGAALPDSVVQDFSTAVTLIESGLIVAAETTKLTTTETFEVASQAIRGHFTERDATCSSCSRLIESGAPGDALPHLESIIDVRRCHREGILPLPVRFERDGVLTIIIDPGPNGPPVVERRDAVTRRLLPQTIPARVQQWKNDLLDLTFRNSLLNFKPAKTGAEIVVPAGLLGVIEDHISRGDPVTIVPHDNLNAALKAGGFRFARDLNQDDLQKYWNANLALFAGLDEKVFDTRIRRVVSRAKTEEQDTGSNNLFLTFGSLKWSDPKSTTGEVRSPIFMVPIRIVMKRGRTSAQLIADPNGYTTINYCLIEALRAKMGMTLQWFSDDMSDDAGLDIEAGLQAMRKEILEKGLTGRGFEVLEDASIGLLRFTKIRLWKDLDQEWERFKGNSVVAHLIDGGRGSYVDPADPERLGIPVPRDYELLNPQSADGPQALAVRRALAGHSFVLEGPPGTGKSQTITNLLAAALASGKKVLFVAEKQAALQVVHERLTQVGLHPFCLELHDKGAKPERIKEQLREALDYSPSVDEAEWARLAGRFEASTLYLDSYRDKLHSPNDAGLSYFEAYIRLLRLGPGPQASCSRRVVAVEDGRIAAYRSTLVQMEDLAIPAQPRPMHPWGLAGPVEFSKIDRAELSQAIIAIGKLRTAVDGGDQWMNLIGLCRSIDELEALESVARLNLDHVTPSIEQWRDIARPEWSTEMSSLLDQIDVRIGESSVLIGSIGVDGLRQDYSNIRTDVGAALGSFILGRRGRVTQALGALATRPPFSSASHDQLPTLLDGLVASSADVQSLVDRVVAKASGVLPADWFPSEPTVVPDARTRIESAATAARFLASGSELAAEALRVATGLAAARPAVGDAIESLRGWMAKMAAILSSTDESFDFWLGGRTLLESIDGSMSTWAHDEESGTYRQLQRWLEFTSAVESIDDESLAGFRTELRSGVIAGSDASDAFERALMTATLTEVGEARDLDVFEHTSHDRRISEFTADLSERQRLLRRVIPKMLHDSRGFDTSSTQGKVGALRQELGSKRRGARSIRSLLSNYPDLISNLTPCFLMSPDSVANFIEPGKIQFDLVVFDEASQITVSSAVGVLGRADAAVIVGDSKQMPPTRFGIASGSGEEDEFGDRLAELDTAVIADAESILDECVESRMDRAWLAWHYRSEDEVLIQFSNDHYYERRLFSFPGAQKQIPGCGIEYRRVDGQFDHGGRRVNVVEADAIVGEVLRRLSDPVERRFSIGIVTLNVEQRELIIDRLRATGDPRIEKALDPSNEDEEKEALFVLNLESVQGRERDVIILGTSFSKREGGGRMPLNFGPLTTKGGERRLNVAVTRARRKVIVVSSFDPSDLASANSVGMVHLREYLEMAKVVSEGSRPETVRSADGDGNLHQLAIVEALRSRGLHVEPNVGLSSFRVDIAVSVPERPDRWLLGILLDGPSWAGRQLVSDRDALPLTILEQKMGWRKVMRVWLPAWRTGADEIVDEIDAVVRRLAIEPDPVEEEMDESEDSLDGTETTSVAGDPLPSIADGPDTAAPVRSTPVTEPSERREFVPIPNVSPIGSLEDLERDRRRGAAELAQLVDTYGPLMKERAIKATLNKFGLATVRESRIRQFADLVDRARVISTPFGEFVFPISMVDGSRVPRDRFDWYRASTFSERSIDEIAPHEVANCAVVLVRRSFSMSEDELVDALLSEFGYQRKSAEAKDLVRRLIDWTIDAGYLVREGSDLKVGN